MRTSTFTATALTLASTARAFTYSIGVGKNEVDGQPGIGFDPSYTVIVPHSDGNTLAFEFLGGVHRVVQTSGVSAPCSPAGGFDSGVVRVPEGTLQGNGPTQTFQIENDTAVMYFADIGEDSSACYLGAVFCINTDESNPSTACYAARSAALALGQQYGVTATPSNTASRSSASSSSAASSTANSTSSAPSSTGLGASRTASANNEAATQSGGNGAGTVRVGGVLSALAAAAGLAVMA